ncbi:EscU/YscU/HrcU family type III secretion system export apparatus switch protein [Pendulispora rubella]|uniref:EscU/YscU/HrcU family type III secretion system export apparatus switch protein n=1 Tax=Pendulispora rubella TaxID=2741070 RepID=A0ABZ2LH17_9BACT
MKTEEPTPRRLRKARAEGDSGASSYAAGSLGFLAAVLTVPAAAYALKDWAAEALRLAIGRAGELDPQVSLDAWAIGRPVLLYAVPLLAAAAGTVVTATVVQTGGVITAKRVAPELRRINVLEGARQLFSREHAFTVGRAFFSAALIATFAYAGLRAHTADIAALAGRVPHIAPAGAIIALRLARSAAILGLAVGALDLVVRRRLWLSRLRMTKAEVDRERRESEGDPEWKAARARAHHERMVQATRAELRDAAVLVVGRTLAVALRYREGDRAPVLIAREEGARAHAVAQTAHELGVPVIEEATLAAALSSVAVGDEIPASLYDAAAEVIHQARTR